MRANWITAVALGYAEFDVERAANGCAATPTMASRRLRSSRARSLSATRAAVQLVDDVTDDQERDRLLRRCVAASHRVLSSAGRTLGGRVTDEEMRTRSIGEVASIWAQYDLPAARKWVVTLDDGPAKDQALTGAGSARRRLARRHVGDHQPDPDAGAAFASSADGGDAAVAERHGRRAHAVAPLSARSCASAPVRRVPAAARPGRELAENSRSVERARARRHPTRDGARRDRIPCCAPTTSYSSPTEGAQALADYGVRTVIDLRWPGEVAARPHPVAARMAVRYHTSRCSRTTRCSGRRYRASAPRRCGSAWCWSTRGRS